MKTKLTIFVMLWLVGCVPSDDQYSDFLDRMHNVANYINMDQSLSNEQKLKSIMDTIYQNVPLKNTDGYDWLAVDERYMNAIEGIESHVCGGLGLLLMIGLESQGIECRYVGAYTSNDPTSPEYATHVMVEVNIDGDWILADPTFKYLFMDEAGKKLSAYELHQIIKDNGTFCLSENLNPRLAIPEDYYREYIQFLYIHPSWRIPTGWDGAPVVLFQGIYVLLYDGPMR